MKNVIYNAKKLFYIEKIIVTDRNNISFEKLSGLPEKIQKWMNKF